MSWFKPLLRSTILALAVMSGAALAGCTMAPVHGGFVEEGALDVAYGEPNSRTEQLIYQELALRLGESSAPSVPLVSVSAAISGATEALSETRPANPNTMRSLTITARMTVSPRDGSATAPVTITRTATAEYTTNAQALSAQEARDEAEERAARAVAESLRLALLASYAR